MTGAAEHAHTGVVVKLAGDMASVHFQRSAMCRHCGACLTLDSGEMETLVKNTLSAKPGDRVAVSIEPKRIMSAAILAYGVPLAMLLIGLYLGSLISDAVSVLLGLSLCACSYLLLRRLEKTWTKKETYAPKMTAIMMEEDNDG